VLLNLSVVNCVSSCKWYSKAAVEVHVARYFEAPCPVFLMEAYTLCFLLWKFFKWIGSFLNSRLETWHIDSLFY